VTVFDLHSFSSLSLHSSGQRIRVGFRCFGALVWGGCPCSFVRVGFNGVVVSLVVGDREDDVEELLLEEVVEEVAEKLEEVVEDVVDELADVVVEVG
jgi:hypothetical protein